MDARPGNLPAEVTNFVGRQRDIEQLRKMLAVGRLITLTGPGGVGKSRLARRFATSVRDTFPDGIWLVELGELRASDLLPFQVARAIGIKNSSGDPMNLLAQHLAPKRLMLVIDNCEHMVSCVVELIRTLLATAPDLQIVTTSRQVLGAEGEHIFEVSPLPHGPSADVAETGSPGRVSDATQLFLDRATAVVPNLVVKPDTMQGVVQLCQRLEGMPLAIELAAARLRAYSVHDILARLEHSFGVLISGSQSAPPRHRALEATIDWSFNLCSPTEQLLWTRLSVFAGGFDIEAAENACADGRLLRSEIFDLLAGLVDKSVLSSRSSSSGPGNRFTMLETVREFGQARLAESGTSVDIKRRHIKYFGALAERYHVDYFSEREINWFKALSVDLPNLRVALQNCLDKPGEADAALQIASCLRMYWASPGLILEGIQWLRKALELAPEPSPDRAEALWTCAYLELVHGDVDRGIATAAECRQLAEKLSLDRIQAFLMLCSVLADSLVGDLDAALVHAQEAAQRGRGIGSAVLTGEALTLAFMMAFRLDRPETATIGQEALDFLEAEDSQFYRAFAQWIQGLVHCRRGSAATAMVCLADAFEVFDAVGHDLGIATCLGGFAWAAAISDEATRGARLLGAAHAIWQTGPLREPHQWFRHKVAEPVEALIRNAIGEDAFKAAFDEGTQQEFHRLLDRPGHTGNLSSGEANELPPADGSAALTRREFDVAELVAKGLTNSEIASELVLSRRTVESHVYHIFAKLGVRSRTRVADWFANSSDSALEVPSQS
jgi:predicted ATPase/DNA-binding CsgD family transcriptional regulator